MEAAHQIPYAALTIGFYGVGASSKVGDYF
jgi:hypothetical protein